MSSRAILFLISLIGLLLGVVNSDKIPKTNQIIYEEPDESKTFQGPAVLQQYFQLRRENFTASVNKLRLFSFLGSFLKPSTPTPIILVINSATVSTTTTWPTMTSGPTVPPTTNYPISGDTGNFATAPALAATTSGPVSLGIAYLHPTTTKRPRRRRPQQRPHVSYLEQELQTRSPIEFETMPQANFQVKPQVEFQTRPPMEFQTRPPMEFQTKPQFETQTRPPIEFQTKRQFETQTKPPPPEPQTTPKSDLQASLQATPLADPQAAISENQQSGLQSTLQLEAKPQAGLLIIPQLFSSVRLPSQESSNYWQIFGSQSIPAKKTEPPQSATPLERSNNNRRKWFKTGGKLRFKLGK